jgi:hypothetical protein
MSKDKVIEEDIFVYNQTATCGSRGMACIALAIVDSKGHLIQYNSLPKPGSSNSNEIVMESEFETLTETILCNPTEERAFSKYFFFRENLFVNIF